MRRRVCDKPVNFNRAPTADKSSVSQHDTEHDIEHDTEHDFEHDKEIECGFCCIMGRPAGRARQTPREWIAGKLE